eukprot:15479470-Alexandrium_andersonii.AAC.1
MSLNLVRGPGPDLGLALCQHLGRVVALHLGSEVRSDSRAGSWSGPLSVWLRGAPGARDCADCGLADCGFGF